jgi:hypothetical protein
MGAVSTDTFTAAATGLAVSGWARGGYDHDKNYPQVFAGGRVDPLYPSDSLLDGVSYYYKSQDAPSTPVADAYDSTKAYSAGDSVVYNGALYTCNADIAAPSGNWDSTAWSPNTDPALDWALWPSDADAQSVPAGTYTAKMVGYAGSGKDALSPDQLTCTFTVRNDIIDGTESAQVIRYDGQAHTVKIDASFSETIKKLYAGEGDGETPTISVKPTIGVKFYDNPDYSGNAIVTDTDIDSSNDAIQGDVSKIQLTNVTLDANGDPQVKDLYYELYDSTGGEQGAHKTDVVVRGQCSLQITQAVVAVTWGPQDKDGNPFATAPGYKNNNMFEYQEGTTNYFGASAKTPSGQILRPVYAEGHLTDHSENPGVFTLVLNGFGIDDGTGHVTDTANYRSTVDASHATWSVMARDSNLEDATQKDANGMSSSLPIYDGQPHAPNVQGAYKDGSDAKDIGVTYYNDASYTSTTLMPTVTHVSDGTLHAYYMLSSDKDLALNSAVDLKVLPRMLSYAWSATLDDSTVPAPSIYAYDGGPHTPAFTLQNLAAGEEDQILAILHYTGTLDDSSTPYDSDAAPVQPGTYTASVQRFVLAQGATAQLSDYDFTTLNTLMGESKLNSQFTITSQASQPVAKVNNWKLAQSGALDRTAGEMTKDIAQGDLVLSNGDGAQNDPSVTPQVGDTVVDNDGTQGTITADNGNGTFNVQTTANNLQAQNLKLNMVDGDGNVKTSYEYGSTPLEPKLDGNDAGNDVQYYYKRASDRDVQASWQPWDTLSGTPDIEPPLLNVGNYTLRAIVQAGKGYSQARADTAFSVTQAGGGNPGGNPGGGAGAQSLGIESLGAMDANGDMLNMVQGGDENTAAGQVSDATPVNDNEAKAVGVGVQALGLQVLHQQDAGAVAAQSAIDLGSDGTYQYALMALQQGGLELSGVTWSIANTNVCGAFASIDATSGILTVDASALPTNVSYAPVVVNALRVDPAGNYAAQSANATIAFLPREVRSISVNTQNMTFDSMTVGQAPTQQSQDIVITNTGTRATDNIVLALGGNGNSVFGLSGAGVSDVPELTIQNIPVGSSATVTVSVNTDTLPNPLSVAQTYVPEIGIAAAHGLHNRIGLSLTINKQAIDSIDVAGVTAPITGGIPDSTATPVSGAYHVSQMVWGPTPSSDVFDPYTPYTVGVQVAADENHYISGTVAASLSASLSDGTDATYKAGASDLRVEVAPDGSYANIYHTFAQTESSSMRRIWAEGTGAGLTFNAGDDTQAVIGGAYKFYALYTGQATSAGRSEAKPISVGTLVTLGVISLADDAENDNATTPGGTLYSTDDSRHVILSGPSGLTITALGTNSSMVDLGALSLADPGDGSDIGSNSIQAYVSGGDGNTVNAIITACDSNGDGVLNIYDKAAQDYVAGAQFADQPQSVQDAFTAFDKSGTLFDNYSSDIYAWNYALASCLSALNAYWQVSNHTSDTLTQTDLNTASATFKQATDALKVSHAPLAVDVSPDAYAQNQVTVLKYGDGVSVRFAGDVTSVDITKPLVVGNTQFSIVPSGNDQQGLPTYSLVNGNDTEGKITASTVVKLNSSFVDTLHETTDSNAAYPMTMNFVDGLSGVSTATESIIIDRSSGESASGSSASGSSAANSGTQATSPDVSVAEDTTPTIQVDNGSGGKANVSNDNGFMSNPIISFLTGGASAKSGLGYTPVIPSVSAMGQTGDTVAGNVSGFLSGLTSATSPLEGLQGGSNGAYGNATDNAATNASDVPVVGGQGGAQAAQQGNAGDGAMSAVSVVIPLLIFVILALLALGAYLYMSRKRRNRWLLDGQDLMHLK